MTSVPSLSLELLDKASPQLDEAIMDVDTGTAIWSPCIRSRAYGRFLCFTELANRAGSPEVLGTQP